MQATLGEPRIVGGDDPYGIANIDGVDVIPEHGQPKAIAFFNEWTIRVYPEGRTFEPMFDAYVPGTLAITMGYRNVVDLISDLRSGHYDS